MNVRYLYCMHCISMVIYHGRYLSMTAMHLQLHHWLKIFNSLMKRVIGKIVYKFKAWILDGIDNVDKLLGKQGLVVNVSDAAEALYILIYINLYKYIYMYIWCYIIIYGVICHHWTLVQIMACRLFSAELNRFIVNWTIRNKLWWNQNSNIFIQEIACENVVSKGVDILFWPQYILQATGLDA